MAMAAGDYIVGLLGQRSKKKNLLPISHNELTLCGPTGMIFYPTLGAIK